MKKAMMKRIHVIVLACLLLTKCLSAVVFPYNPRPQIQQQVNTAMKENHCPQYSTRYDKGNVLAVVLREGQCEMFIDKFQVYSSMSVQGDSVAGEKEKINYIPILNFRSLSPLCPTLPYQYKGMHVVVQTTYNCQLVFGIRHFKELSGRFGQVVEVARPVIENLN